MEDLDSLCNLIYIKLLAALDYQAPRHHNQLSSTYKDRKYLTPVGSYGLGVWTPGDDLHFLCMVDISLSTFWEYVGEALKTTLEPANLQVVLPFDLDVFADIETASLAGSGTRVLLHACTLPRATDIAERPLRPPGYEVAKPSSLYGTAKSSHSLQSKKLNMYRDMQYRSFIPYHMGQRAGVYSSTFGYLDSDRIIWMLAKIAIPQCSSSLSKLLEDFFTAYTARDWSPTPDTTPIQRIYTHYEPRVNVAATATTTPQSLRTVTAMLSMAVNSLADLRREGVRVHSETESSLSDESAEKVWMRDLQQDLSESHPTSNLVDIVVSADHWSTNPRKRLEFASWVEREVCVSLVQALQQEYRQYPGATFRIWPAPYEKVDVVDSKVLYWIVAVQGIWYHCTGVEFSTSEKRRLEQSLQEFAEALVYNRVDGFVDVSFETYCPAGKYRLRRRSRETATEPSSISLSTSAAPNNDRHQPSYPSATTQLSAKPGSPVIASNSEKLLPADKVLKRLRWHEAHRHTDWEIGYEDRFEGLMWLPLEMWEKDVSHDEFIPYSRVRIFRRRRDGLVVWDRENRIDRTGEGLGR
ncbi:hypothetical protein H2203_007907 [Taxawa tesnikishii (nom. ined.)]|nr:hypothetical protein H2203_007907 [Dothideales sp. JES 119]